MSENSEEAVQKLYDEAKSLIEARQYNDALPATENAYNQALSILGKNHFLTVKCLRVLAGLNIILGDFHLAEIRSDEVVKILEGELKGDDVEYAAALITKVTLRAYQGRFFEAEECCERALELLTRSSGRESIHVASCLANLGSIQVDIGNNDKADRFFKEALDIYRKTTGEEHPYYAITLSNMGNMYFKMGNVTSSVETLEKSIDVWKKTLGDDNPSFAHCCQNTAVTYTAMGKFSEAEKLFFQAIEIYERTMGREQRDYAQSLNNLADLYVRMEKFDRAEPLFKEALQIRKKIFDHNHPFIAHNLNSLGYLYYLMGGYEEAEIHLREAITIRRKVIGSSHIDLAENLSNLANVCVATGKLDEALELSREVSSIHDRAIAQVFSIGHEKERMARLEKPIQHLHTFLSMINRHFPDDPECAKLALDLVLRRKALGAEALAAQRDAVMGGKYPELKPMLLKLTNLRMQIAQKTFKGPGPEGEETHDKLLGDWTRQKESLESELVSKIPEMDLEEKLRAADRRHIAGALPDDSVLIEFIRYREFDFNAVTAQGDEQWKSARYTAFVMGSAEPDRVEMVDLGGADYIDRLINDFRSSVLNENIHEGDGTSGGNGQNGKSGYVLRESVFDKLIYALGESKRLLMAPDGDLNRLPFEVLPVDRNKCLIDNYLISYLSVGRDALRLQQESEFKPEISLVAADPEFNMGSTSGSVKSPGRYSKWRQSRDLDGSKIEFNNLPGTRPEGERIAEFLGVQP